MKNHSCKKVLSFNWEWPYMFISYLKGKGDANFDEGRKICIVKNTNEQGKVAKEIWRYMILDKLIEVVRFDFFFKGGITPFGKKEISCEAKCSCWE